MVGSISYMKNIRQSFQTGLSFGLTSAVITTLGLIVGLHSGTHSKIVILGGILTIAIADSFSDALGIHVSEESNARRNQKQIWESTFATLVSKLLITLTFVIPVLAFGLTTAVIVSIIWGLALVTGFSFYIAKQQKNKIWTVAAEHFAITVLVIIATHYVGDFINILIKNVGI